MGDGEVGPDRRQDRSPGSERVDAIADKVGRLEDGLKTLVRGKNRTLEEALAAALEDTTPESPGDMRGKEVDPLPEDEDQWI